jgi:hypothetical protein
MRGLVVLAFVTGCGFDVSGFADRSGGGVDAGTIDGGANPKVDGAVDPELDAAPGEPDGALPPACAEPWVDEETGCHLFVKTLSASWDGAELDCEAQGGHLVVEDADGEFSQVAAGMGPLDANGRFWIGLHDPAPDDNVMVWVDGRALTETHWNGTEPNNNGDCVSAHDDGTWGDRNCGEARTYACEKND